jgi:hypothetical protein
MTPGPHRLDAAKGTIVSAISDLYDGDLKNDYFNALRCSNMKFTKTILNSGPYDMRNSIGGFVQDDCYIVKVNFYAALEKEGGAELQSDDLELTVTLKDMAGSGDLFTITETISPNASKLYALEKIVSISGDTITAEKLKSSNYRLEFKFAETEADTIFITKCECY